MDPSVCLLLLLAVCTAEGVHHGQGGGYHGSRGHHGAVYDQRDSEEGGWHHSDDDDKDDTVYRFAIGGNYGPYEYLDETGRLRGFNVDLLYAVCAKAGKKCTWLINKYSNCWAGAGDGNAHLEYPGVGLLSGYYDACLGWMATQERSNSFNFSIAFTENVDIALYYRKTAEGDLHDLTGKKVGLVSGWLWNKKCLARQTFLKGNKLGDYTAVMFSSNLEMANALHEGYIDTAMAVKSHVDSSSAKDWSVGVERSFSCSSDGLAVMARYSRMDIIDWWNHAFEELRGTGAFRRLCEQARKDHGHRGDINCAL